MMTTLNGEWTTAAQIRASAMRAPLALARVGEYLLAGHAVVTFLSTRTGARFTYKVVQAEATERYPAPAWFVNVLTGPDNTADFNYIGVIRDGKFQRTARSTVGPDAPSFKAFAFVWSHREALPPAIQVFHEGRCGRCGRVLTVPESVTTGYGPTCAGRLP